ncbi:MAG: hypothetical protein ACPGVG_17385 [Mycobacterium sp.]
MTYAADAAAAGFDVLTPRIRMALANNLTAQGVSAALAAAVRRQPNKAIPILTAHLVTIGNITVDSTDSEINTALRTLASLQVLKDVYSVSA